VVFADGIESSRGNAVKQGVAGHVVEPGGLAVGDAKEMQQRSSFQHIAGAAAILERIGKSR
jgi:hypothetical protein